MSGAFIPVSEDQGMIDAVAAGALSLAKLEAMTTVCSVGIDMIAVPGNSSAATLTGLIADEMAIGMVNNKTTAVRVIPIPGRGPGEKHDWGGLYGPALFCNQGRFWNSYHSNSPCGVTVFSDTVPVESYAPNAFGLYDMHGNVWEWCLDSDAPYSSAAVTDPFVTGGPARVFRGGGWGNGSRDCRSAQRGGTGPGFTYFVLGFRVVLAPVLVP